MPDIKERTIADAIVEHLPIPHVLNTMAVASQDILMHVAVPKGYDLKTIDNEANLVSPRRAKGIAVLDNHNAFVEYVSRHDTGATVVWCSFDPQTSHLSFTAVFDDHGKYTPGWRGLRAQFKPQMANEWKTWSGHNEKQMPQFTFAEFLERNAIDINAGEPAVYPSSLQMLAMATQFEATSDKKIKSAVRLQSGGVRIEYIDDVDAGTVAQMSAFDKFQIGIPVFWSGTPYRIEARLKWRQRDGALHFFYELIRPDLVHETAAENLIGLVREGIGGVPLMMGKFD